MNRPRFEADPLTAPGGIMRVGWGSWCLNDPLGAVRLDSGPDTPGGFMYGQLRFSSAGRSFAQARIGAMAGIGSVGFYLFGGGIPELPALVLSAQPGEGGRLIHWTGAAVAGWSLYFAPWTVGDVLRAEIRTGEPLRVIRNAQVVARLPIPALLEGWHGIRIAHDSQGSALRDYRAGDL